MKNGKNKGEMKRKKTLKQKEEKTLKFKQFLLSIEGEEVREAFIKNERP